MTRDDQDDRPMSVAEYDELPEVVAARAERRRRAVEAAAEYDDPRFGSV